ncbi:MAG TPA: sulfite exporter TauE/SafE family protein [Vicinamibacterales bacterium]|nr:sulfite exporter TauE/SafE family protein [Vicinamibacterales bacterium]
MLAAAIVPGVLIGAALGLLGGGGSVLTVPIFVYVLGFSPKEAIAMSLAVVAVTSAIGVASHWRAGTVNIPIAIAFGAVAMPGTLLGVRLARFVPGTTQLLIFAAVMLAAAVFMLRGRPSGDEPTSQPTVERPLASALRVAPAGLLVGTLTGFVGVGGGFLIVPALVLMRMSIRQAVGTSLLVITGTCIVGFLGYLGHVQLNWTAVAFVATGTVPGIMLGAYLHRFVPQAALRRGFAAFLVVVAAFIFLENLGPLSAVTRHSRSVHSGIQPWSAE